MSFKILAVCLLICFFVNLFPLSGYAQTPAEIQNYIDHYGQLALSQEREYGIPASITLAQGILESGAGTSRLARNANNHFGIKALGRWSGPIYLAWDDEPVKSRFRKYESVEDSFRDHAQVLRDSPRYRSLFQRSVYDYRAWAIGLQAAGYATSANYAKALIGYIDAYALYSLNGGVKLRPGVAVTITTKVVADSVYEWQMDEEETTEEQALVEEAVNRFVVEINGVRCTLLNLGQSLSDLAQRYDLPLQKLLNYNEVESVEDFKEGDVVFLAPKKRRYHGMQDYYVVREGDSFHSIAQRFGIKLPSLLRLNGKAPISSVQVGEKLLLK